MNEALNFLLGLAILIFAAYVLIFGGVGALLARHRGGSAAIGFMLGLIPLIGWLTVVFVTRTGSRRISADEWLDEEPGLASSSWPSQTGSQPSRLPSATSSDPHDY